MSLWEVVGLKDALLSSQGPKGTGAAAPGFAEKPQGWRELRVCFAASLMQPKPAPGKSRAGVWGARDAKVTLLLTSTRAQPGTAHPLPPQLP